MTLKPPLSVKVGPSQFMNLPSPPASSTMSGPGCRYRWYALASNDCAPSSFMDSGSTALTVALVPTATNDGVAISPCGVWMVPVRPSRSSSLVPIVKIDSGRLSTEGAGGVGTAEVTGSILSQEQISP